MILNRQGLQELDSRHLLPFCIISSTADARVTGENPDRTTEPYRLRETFTIFAPLIRVFALTYILR